MEGWPQQVDDPILVSTAGVIYPRWMHLVGWKSGDSSPGREALLLEVHGGHPGISRMKSLARSLMWWPRMDSEIEEVVKHCEECQQDRPAPPSAPLHPWSWPTRPWTRLHIDFAGPLEGKMFLVVVDAHSK